MCPGNLLGWIYRHPDLKPKMLSACGVFACDLVIRSSALVPHFRFTWSSLTATLQRLPWSATAWGVSNRKDCRYLSDTAENSFSRTLRFEYRTLLFWTKKGSSLPELFRAVLCTTLAQHSYEQLLTGRRFLFEVSCVCTCNWSHFVGLDVSFLVCVCFCSGIHRVDLLHFLAGWL